MFRSREGNAPVGCLGVVFRTPYLGVEALHFDGLATSHQKQVRLQEFPRSAARKVPRPVTSVEAWLDLDQGICASSKVLDE